VTLLAATNGETRTSRDLPRCWSRCVLLTSSRWTTSGPRPWSGRLSDGRWAGRRGHPSRPTPKIIWSGLAAVTSQVAEPPWRRPAAFGQAQGVTKIDLATAEKAVDVAPSVDRDGDAHYDRDQRVHQEHCAVPTWTRRCSWLARMLVAGEDPRFIALGWSSSPARTSDGRPTALLTRDRRGQAVA